MQSAHKSIQSIHSSDDEAVRKYSISALPDMMDTSLDKHWSSKKLMTKGTGFGYDSAGSTQYMSGMDTTKQPMKNMMRITDNSGHF